MDRDNSSTLQKIEPWWVNCESGFSSFTLHAHTRARTHVTQAACSLFFSSLHSIGRRPIRSGPFVSPIYVTRRRGPSGRTRRCRKRVRFNAVLLLPAYNTRSPSIALLSFCSLRVSLRARYTYRAALSRSDPLLWQPLNWLFGVCICR